MSKLLDTKAAAARLGVSVWYLYDLARAGVVPCVRLTPKGRLRFREADLAALLGEPTPAQAG